MNLTWLAGDLHCHCERHELLEALLSGVVQRLDFFALTNHPHKPIFAEQPQMIARARAACPTLAIFFGVEWNGLGGRHTNLIFPPGPREADHAAAFLAAHDAQITGREPDLPAAFAMLRALPAAERPVVFINHPSVAVGFTPEHLDQLTAAAETPGLFIGMEALHGHQAWAHVLAEDPHTYPASRLGGLCDHQYRRGRACALLSDSDFHIHKQPTRPDYPLGVFQHTRVAVPAAITQNQTDIAARARAIFDGLRHGRTCAAQGRWCDLTEFTARAGQAEPAGLGDCIDATAPATVRIRLQAAEPLRSIELLGSLAPDQPPQVLFRTGAQPAGPIAAQWELPAGADGFVRLRIIAARDTRPPVPDMDAPLPPAAPRWLLSSAIFLTPGWRTGSGTGARNHPTPQPGAPRR